MEENGGEGNLMGVLHKQREKGKEVKKVEGGMNIRK